MSSRIALSIAAGLTVALLAATAACSQTGPDTKAVKSGDQVVFGDWTLDAPGVRHKITLQDLPAPEGGTAAPAQVAPPPDGALPKVPAGLQAARFATGLEGPRAMRTAPNGDIFVAEQPAGRIRVLRAADGAAAPSQNSTFIDGLDQPFGIGFYPLGPNPQWIYIAENNRVIRLPYQNGDLKARGAAEVIIPQLSATTGGHWTRDLVFSPDGARMFVSIGSVNNLSDMPKKSPKQLKAWDKAHGMGASWGPDTNRAAVMVSDPTGKGAHLYATGIRNCSGLTVQPGTGEVWCSTNERDMTGDNLVPDYITHVEQGHFYGWPWYYMGDHEDPRMKGDRPDLKGKVTVPDVMIQAHSAAVEIRFYDGSGPSALPTAYTGQAFVSLHGSWNRSHRTGYKVVVAEIKDGKATGEYTDFMTGFVLNASDVWGRPYGLAVMHDGSLLVGDDANGTIFRVSPAR